MSIFLINGDGIDETTNLSFTLQFKSIAEDHQIPWEDVDIDLKEYRIRELASGSITWPQSMDMFEYGSFFSTIGEVSATNMTYDATNKYYYNSSVTYSVETTTIGQEIVNVPPFFGSAEAGAENDEGTLYGEQANIDNGTNRYYQFYDHPFNQNEPDDLYNQIYFVYSYKDTYSGDYLQVRISDSVVDTAATWTTVVSVDQSPNYPTYPNNGVWSTSQTFANRPIPKWYMVARYGYGLPTVTNVDKEIFCEAYGCYAHKQYATQYLETQTFTITNNTLVVHPFIRLPNTFNIYFKVYYWDGATWILIDKYIPNDVTSMIGNTSKLRFEFEGPIDTRYRPEFYGFMMINYKRGY